MLFLCKLWPHYILQFVTMNCKFRVLNMSIRTGNHLMNLYIITKHNNKNMNTSYNRAIHKISRKIFLAFINMDFSWSESWKVWDEIIYPNFNSTVETLVVNK